MYSCTHKNCSKTYSSTKALNHHVRQCHSSEDERVCQICGTVFSSKSARKRHFDECNKETPNFTPNSVVNTEKNEFNRHLHVPVKLNNCGSLILEEFTKWMKNGGFSCLLSKSKRKLTEKSISTYALHLRSFIGFVIEAKKTREDIILCSTNINTYKEFIIFLEKSNYCAKTIANKLFAMERLVAFIYEEMENLKAKELTTLSCNNHIKNNLTEVMKFLKSESSSISPAANRETMVRNCRQSLEAEGKWENLATILQKFHGSFNFHLVNVNIQISSSHQ